MTERPILMTPENAQKCHDGIKTQTRRIVKAQPDQDVEWFGYLAANRQDSGFYPMKGNPVDSDCWMSALGEKINCPYGFVGDRLWVREAWYQAFKSTSTNNGCVYKGQDNGLELNPGWSPKPNGKGWRRSIHMPRWACRTVLEITEIRVERLQEITPDDAIAEGVFCPEIGYVQHGDRAPVLLFGVLWESIHGKGSWDKNPWVWVISFRKVLS